MYTFTLPNGIAYKDKLYNKVVMDEMTGKQQDYLVNPNYKSSVAHIKPIMCDLVQAVTTQDEHKLEVLDPTKPNFHKENLEAILLDYLPVEDLQYLLVKLREVTFGTNLFLDRPTCPHCKTKSNSDAKIDIASLEIKDKQFKALEPHETFLPKAQSKLKYRPLTLRNLIAEQSEIDTLLSNMSTLTAYMCTHSIDDQPVTQDDFKTMKALDIKHVQNNYPELNHIDMTVTHMCSNSSCLKEWDEDLEVMHSNFFSPTKT